MNTTSINNGQSASRGIAQREKRRDFSWARISDTELLEKAQERIACTGIADPKSFDDTYRGIAYELRRRGYSPSDLSYPQLSSPGITLRLALVKELSFRWERLDDDDFIMRVCQKIAHSGAPWDFFIDTHRGIRYEMNRRGLTRDAMEI